MSDGNERGAGWVLFAAMVMVVIGGWGILTGLFAVLDDDKVVALGGQVLILDGVTTWGWIHMLLGAIVLFTGLGLFAGSPAAQVIAMFLVALNAIGQVFTISVYPWWGITMLALNIFVLWALAVYRAPRIE